MKRFLPLFILCIMLIFTVSVNAADKPSYDCDFESISNLSSIPLNLSSSCSGGDYILIADDPTTTGNNHVLKFYNDAAKDRYCTFNYADINGVTELSFKLYAEDGFGTYTMDLRDSLSSKNTISLLSMSSQEAKYLSNVSVTGSLAGKWISFKFIMDFKRDSIICYSDISNGFNGTLAEDYNGKISTYASKYKVHNSYATSLRFGLRSTSGTVYMDDLKFVYDYTSSVDTVVKPPLYDFDFEGYSLEDICEDIPTAANTDWEYIDVAPDPTNAGNSVLKFYGDGALKNSEDKYDRYASLLNLNLYGESELSFKFYAENDFTSYTMYFRDSLSTSNNIILMQLLPGSVTYLGDTTVAGNITGRWITFKFVMDFKNNSLTCYSDVSGTLKADYSGTIPNFDVHNSHSTNLRFGLMTNTGTVYMDDLRFVYNYSQAPTVHADGKLLYTYNFEDCKLSDFPEILISSGTTSDNISVITDPTNAKNSVLKLYNNTSATKMLRFENLNIEGKTEFSFKIYPETGFKNYTIGLYNTNTTSSIIEFYNGYVKYLDASTKTASLSGKWVTFKFIIDSKTKYVTCYSDITTGFNGVLAQDYYGRVSISDSDINSMQFRFGLGSNAGTAYMDDLVLKHNYSLTDSFYVSNQKMYKKYLSLFTGLSYLREGETTFYADVTASGASKNLMLIAAQYSKDGYMKLVSSSVPTLVSNGSTQTLSATMNMEDLDAEDYVKLFILENGNISPLSKVFTFKTSGTYYRPNPIEIKTDFYSQNTDETHPRVVATKSDFDRMRSYAKTDDLFKKWLASIKATADSLHNTKDLPVMEADASGNIIQQARKTMNAVLPLAMMYQMSETPAEKAVYAEDVWLFVDRVCDTTYFPHWNNAHYLDTAEMAFAVAIAYDWCYDYWTDERLEIMRTALYKNIINESCEYFMGVADYETGHRNQSNWCPVTNAGAITACIALFDKYPELCSYVIASSCEALENCLGDYAIDGGYSESSTYWEYGTTYLMWCMATLDSTFGKTYGIEEADGLSNTGFFPYYATGPLGSWAYHDSSNDPIGTQLSLFFAKKYNNPDLAGLRAYVLENGYYGNDVEPSCIDLLFYDDALMSSDFEIDDLSLDTHYKHVQTVFMRSSFTDTNATFVGFHGGWNRANHGDIDAGNFIIDMQGTHFIDEMRADSYTLPDYFSVSGARWKYLRKNAEGQNTIAIVDDSTIPYGQNFNANVEITEFESGNNFSYAIADMTPALGAKVTSAKRGLMLLDNRSEVVVQDEITFNTATELYWIACVRTKYEKGETNSEGESLEGQQRGSITLSADQKSAIIEIDGKRMQVKLNSDNANLKFELKDAVNALLPGTDTSISGQTSRDAITRLVIHGKGVTTFNVSVSFKLIEDENADEADITYNKTSLANWKSYNN